MVREVRPAGVSGIILLCPRTLAPSKPCQQPKTVIFRYSLRRHLPIRVATSPLPYVPAGGRPTRVVFSLIDNASIICLR